VRSRPARPRRSNPALIALVNDNGFGLVVLKQLRHGLARATALLAAGRAHLYICGQPSRDL